MNADSCLWLSRKGCPARISALSFPLLLQPSIFFLRQYSVNKLRSHTTISQIPPWETGSGGEGGKISGFSPSSYFPHFRPSFFRERCQILTDENSQSLLRRSPVRSGGRGKRSLLDLGSIMQRAAEEGRKTSGDDVLGVTQRCCRRERKLEKLWATKSGAAGRVVSISKKNYATVLFGESFVAGTQKSLL